MGVETVLLAAAGLGIFNTEQEKGRTREQEAGKATAAKKKKEFDDYSAQQKSDQELQATQLAYRNQAQKKTQGRGDTAQTILGSNAGESKTLLGL